MAHQYNSRLVIIEEIEETHSVCLEDYKMPLYIMYA